MWHKFFELFYFKLFLKRCLSCHNIKRSFHETDFMSKLKQRIVTCSSDLVFFFYQETEGLSEARDGPYISRGVNTDRRVQREGFDNDLKIKDLEEKLGAAALRERELQIKLDELNKLTISRIPVPESNLQQIVQSLESQRDFYKEKVDELSRSFHEIEQNRDASASTAGMRRTLMDIIELPVSNCFNIRRLEMGSFGSFIYGVLL